MVCIQLSPASYYAFEAIYAGNWMQLIIYCSIMRFILLNHFDTRQTSRVSFATFCAIYNGLGIFFPCALMNSVVTRYQMLIILNPFYFPAMSKESFCMKAFDLWNDFSQPKTGEKKSVVNKTANNKKKVFRS